MKKLEKILRKDNPKRLFSTAEVRKKKKLMKSALDKHNLFYPIENELDYFQQEVIYTSYLNKIALEKKYEYIKNSEYDLWSWLTYLNRNVIVNQELAELRNQLPHFFIQEKPIYIAFFDGKMNSFYSEEMAIFELIQYHRLYLNFKAQCISASVYGIKPLKAGFSSAEILYHKKGEFILLARNIGVFYIKKENKFYRIPLKDEFIAHFTKGKLNQFAKILLSLNKVEIIDAILNEEKCSSVVAQKLIKYRSKLVKGAEDEIRN